MSDTGLRAALAELAEQAPTTLQRTATAPARRWPAAAAVVGVAAASVVAAGAVAFVSHTPVHHGSVADPAIPSTPFRRLPLRESDAPPPDADVVLVSTAPQRGIPCEAADLQARATDSRVLISADCDLSGDGFALVLADGSAVSAPTEPEQPTRARLSLMGDVVLDYGVASGARCGAGAIHELRLSSGASINGRPAGGVVPVTGSPCGTRNGEPVVVGAPHKAGSPSAIVPQDRQELRVALSDVRTTPLGPRFTVTLSNPTQQPLSLDPCPSYLVAVTRTGPRGGGFSSQTGRLDCDALPPTLRPGTAVSFAGGYAGSSNVASPSASAGSEKVTLVWAIAGPPAMEVPLPS